MSKRCTGGQSFVVCCRRLRFMSGHLEADSYAHAKHRPLQRSTQPDSTSIASSALTGHSQDDVSRSQETDELMRATL